MSLFVESWISRISSMFSVFHSHFTAELSTFNLSCCRFPASLHLQWTLKQQYVFYFRSQKRFLLQQTSEVKVRKSKTKKIKYRCLKIWEIETHTKSCDLLIGCCAPFVGNSTVLLWVSCGICTYVVVMLKLGAPPLAVPPSAAASDTLSLEEPRHVDRGTLGKYWIWPSSRAPNLPACSGSRLGSADGWLCREFCGKQLSYVPICCNPDTQILWPTSRARDIVFSCTVPWLPLLLLLKSNKINHKTCTFSFLHDLATALGADRLFRSSGAGGQQWSSELHVFSLILSLDSAVDVPFIASFFVKNLNTNKTGKHTSSHLSRSFPSVEGGPGLEGFSCWIKSRNQLFRETNKI